MTLTVNQCMLCKHFHGWGSNKNGTCFAFPQGIPVRIAADRFDHTKPYTDDNGVRFTPIDWEASELQKAKFFDFNETSDEYESSLQAEEQLRLFKESERQKQHQDTELRRNLAPLPEPILLMRADGRTMYAVGWSADDLLIDMIDGEGEIIAKNWPIGNFATFAMPYCTMIDSELYKEIWDNRPENVALSPTHPFPPYVDNK